MSFLAGSSTNLDFFRYFAAVLCRGIERRSDQESGGKKIYVVKAVEVGREVGELFKVSSSKFKVRILIWKFCEDRLIGL